MVDIAAIAGALGSIKAASDVANAMLKLRDGQMLQEKIIELNRIILSAQSDAISANGAQMELVAKISKLEEEIACLKGWEAEKARYQLTEIGPGIFALAIKKGMQNGEPFHHICANCCAAGKKSHLQRHISGPYYDEYQCGSCGQTLAVNKGTPPTSTGYISATDF